MIYEHISAVVDTAYARQCGIGFDGTEHPPDDDGLPSELQAWPIWYGDTAVVVLDVAKTNVRVELTPAEARDLAALLTFQASAADAGHPHDADGCCGCPIPIPGMGTPGGAA